MNFIKKIGAFFIFGNFLISAATLSLCAETQLLLTGHIIFRPYYIVVFLATFFVYNLHRFLGIYSDPNNRSGRSNWASNNLTLLKILITVGALALGVSALFLIHQIGWMLIPLCVMTLSYSIPVLKKKGKYIRLRDLPWMKTFLIALVWTTVTVYLPALRENISLTNYAVSLLALERALFIFAITIPFDIRDMEDDKKKGVISLPVEIGEVKSKRLSNWLMLLFIVLAAIQFYSAPVTLLAIAISTIPVFYLIAKSGKEKDDYYYLLWLDGTMIFQAVLIYLFML